MKELTSFDVHNLVKEVQFLVAGKVDNIYQTDSKELYLQIYISGKPKQLLRIVAGKCFYLAKSRPDFSDNMHRFCAYLRKYMLNSRIKAIEQIDYERILKITLETKEGTYDIISELFGKGITLLVKNNKIVSASEEQVWADRKLSSGEVYSYPENKNSEEMFEKQKAKGSDITMDILDKELSKELHSKKLSAKEKEMHRLNTIIEKQSEQLNRVLKESEENKRKGELIYERYQEIKEVVDKAKTSKSVKEALKSNKAFKGYDEKEKKLTLELSNLGKAELDPSHRGEAGK